MDRLQPVLSTKRRVAVLVDNLDQAWESNPDSVQLAHLLVGLLTTINKVSDVLRKRKGERASFLVTLGVFIRSDIYQRVADAAREPDKIPVKRLRWQDEELLLQVPEERYIAGHSPDTPPLELWEKYFTSEVGGIPVRHYIASRVLRRPRDILWFCNAAVDSAVTHRHTVVEQSDLVEAERVYSQFAVESLAVELSGFLPDAEELLYAFAGVDAVLSASDVEDALVGAGVDVEAQTINTLVLFSFLGRETDADVFTFVEDPAEQRRSEALSKAYGSRCECEPRLQVHPAFRAYLGIGGSRPESQQRLNV